MTLRRASRPNVVALGILLAVVVLSGVGHARAPFGGGEHHGAAQQERSKKKERNDRRDPDPSELWSLYPLNPEEAVTPKPPLEEPQDPADESLQQGELTSDEPAAGTSLPPAGSDRPDPVIFVALGGVALVLLVAVGWLFSRRRASPATAVAETGSTSPTEPLAQSSHSAVAGSAGAEDPRPPDAPPISKEHIRVHLSDGRSIEGWKRGSYSADHRVLVLDVDDVYDSSGAKVASTPLDSFLLPPQIQRVELLDDGPARSSEDASLT